MNKHNITILSREQVWGNEYEDQLDVIKKYGVRASATDLSVLTGGKLYDDTDKNVGGDSSLRGRPGAFMVKIDDTAVYTTGVNIDGDLSIFHSTSDDGIIRPILSFPYNFREIIKKRVKGYNDTEEVEYGEYPQYVADLSTQTALESMADVFCINAGNKTGRAYTLDSHSWGEKGIKPVTYEEYEYKGKKYIRIKANPFLPASKCSNGCRYKYGDYVWVEVSPVVWLIDKKTQMLISKRGLVSGVHTKDFQKYLDTYMSKDLFQNVPLLQNNYSVNEKQDPQPSKNIFQQNNYSANKEQDSQPNENIFQQNKNNLQQRRINFKKNNNYGLKAVQVSEEDIIKGAIESGIAVFLHGPSSEGKSARVKQIDPNCEIIYLRNATPESLNGKSVYNSQTGEMMDIKPSWLKKIEEKCEKEPDKFHVVFLDEITNALPSIQGMAFNIVLDREVNGIWKLPENARIVAAGNDMKDSLSANQLAEPLFNRFAHVYIKTTTASWLKWASKHNIHPAIYSYIAYKNGETLRSEYNGETPNADPRKWEMASKMLYTTGNPEMLRALVGEDITREFVQFCRQPVITLDDVINGNYTNMDIRALNTAERYATTMGLSQVDEANLKKVRKFVSKLGAEFVAIFDALWTQDDENRLETLAEEKLGEMAEGGIRR